MSFSPDPVRADDRTELRHEASGVVVRGAGLVLFAAHLQQLDDLESRVLHLVEVEGWSYAEVAVELDLDRADVARLVARARIALAARRTESVYSLGLAEGA